MPRWTPRANQMGSFHQTVVLFAARVVTRLSGQDPPLKLGVGARSSTISSTFVWTSLQR